MDRIGLFISESHKTTKNIRLIRAFTVSLADKAHMDEADFIGIVSGNTRDNKFERTGFTARKSDKVNAPIIKPWRNTLGAVWSKGSVPNLQKGSSILLVRTH